jgi:hypothetical protein
MITEWGGDVNAPQIIRLVVLRRGSVTVKRAPRPSPWLSAATPPPCSSTRCRTRASPSPSPPCGQVVLLSA